MSSFQIKLLAIVLMLIDHIGLLLLPEVEILRILGRLAFPLFAWQLTIGAQHTSNPKRFLSRLLIGGIISQPIYSWFLHLSGADPWVGNIFFSLGLGLATIFALKRVQQLHLKVGIIGLSLLISLAIPISYGFAGLLSILAFHFTLTSWRLMLISQLAIFTLYTTTAIQLGQPNLPSITILSQPLAALAVLIIYFYNQHQGPRATHLFYIFYPLHLLLLSILFALLAS